MTPSIAISRSANERTHHPVWARSSFDTAVDEACERACATIAPMWPLDRAIAVNPHWHRIGQPVRAVAARLAVLGGITVFPDRAYVRTAWASGRITADDLEHALDQVPGARAAGLCAARCLDALNHECHLPRLPLLIDVLDKDPRRHTRLSWRHAITHQVSQTCAAYFDRHQADWQPARSGGLYAFWRETLTHDHGIGQLMGLPRLAHTLHALPPDAHTASRWVLERLELPPAIWPAYLEAVLLTVNGWASWCAYLAWQARLDGSAPDIHLRELLAIRLAWGAILLEGCDDDAAHAAFEAVRQQWLAADAVLQQAQDELLVDEVWQVALELGYQRPLAQQLEQAVSAGTTPPPTVQAVFCIDVRSEPMRRALEAAHPSLQTIGFAGFFGVPADYQPLGGVSARPQLPGLLAPSVRIRDTVVGGNGDAADLTQAATRAQRRRLGWQQAWAAGSHWPGSAFSFVEAAGITYVPKLLRWLRASSPPREADEHHGIPARYRPWCRPTLADLTPAEGAALAARILRLLGLAQQLAPLVLLVGHASQSHNNAHAATLDCGACGGQSGEANVRALARLLNDPAVRAELHRLGLSIPADTCFVAALHNTTTDEIIAFDLDLLGPTARERWQALQPAIERAGDQVRRERAPRLGLAAELSADQRLRALRQRANDGAQTRPEWGLAGNAAFIAAPRARTRGLDLAGRCFLHDYDHRLDPDGSTLELLMTAPMVVAHWINWQYHSSLCDPHHLGSGNKVLHNVVGGHIGVFEGNGGDLRVGLALQSLHDGQRWQHEPLRLTVVIEAPTSAIERVLARHAQVRQLLDNGWLHLWQWQGQTLRRYTPTGWESLRHTAAPAGLMA
jgi:uncharacterized protein YbcC (UPF0753/DUF2309 family)